MPSPAPLPEDPQALAECRELEATRTLACLQGPVSSPLAQAISGKTFLCRENPMGIRSLRLEFTVQDRGVFHYVNQQGEKSLFFGLGKNVFGKFPQAGYSGEHGGLPDESGYLYDCAAGAVWGQENKLHLKVQIIDRYLANLLITFSFLDGAVHVSMVKHAEHFLNEYNGQLLAFAEGSGKE